MSSTPRFRRTAIFGTLASTMFATAFLVPGLAAARVASSGCPSRTTPATADGPSEDARIVQSAGDGQPEISMVRYPRPAEPADGWSQWGQGLALPDGRYVSAIGDERGDDGNSYVFVYDPASQRMTRIGDVVSRIQDAGGSGGYGKIHGQIVPGRCGDAYFATYWGNREEVDYSSTYRGDVLFRLDPTTLELQVLGVPVEAHGIPSLSGRGRDGLVFGEAADPKPATPGDHDLGAFFAYDVSKRKVVFRSDDPRHSLFRNVMIDSKGRAYVAGENGRLLVYERGAQELRELAAELPGGGALRASTRPGPDGTVYGVTQASDPEDATLFALDPDGNIRSLGKAGGYTTSLALSRDGSRIYYVPGAYGDSADEGTPIIAVDTDTGEQSIVARLNPLSEDHLGLTLAGSYNVALDARRNRLYVGLNAGPDRDNRWGEVVLAVVDLAP